MNAFLVDNVSS